MKRVVALLAVAVLVAAVPVRAESNPGSVRKELRENLRESFKETRLQLREASKQSREEFREKLGQVRDAKKRELVERLSDKMCEINRRRTAQMTQSLERMGRILDRVVARTAEAKAKGKDTSKVDSAVVDARKAIGEARSVVSSQAGKACEVVISGDEGALKSEVERARLALEAGLRQAHERVVAARKAVGEAIRALAMVLGEPVPEQIAR